IDTHWDSRSGTFRISHVTAGNYLLTARVHDERTVTVASLPISVGSADVTGIRLDPGELAVEGTVRTEGDTTLRILNFIGLSSERSGQGAAVDDTGKFRIANLMPGTYRVAPQAVNQQWCVRSVLQGGRDVRDSLIVAPGSSPEPLDIVVSRHCGAIDVTFN